MPIVTVDQAKAQLNFSASMGNVDDALIAQKIAAAEAYLDSALGYRLAERYGSGGLPPYPADLAEAALQLVAHWYENREAAGDSLREAPFGVSDAVNAHREWCF